MIDITIRIDCEKTEKALKAISALMNKRVSDILKEELQLNEMLISVANALKEKPELLEEARTKLGDAPVNDLLSILN